MNKRQKTLLTDIITILIITALAVAAMINLKNRVNRSEATRAMEQLSRIVLQYKEKYGSVPPESYIYAVRKDLEGNIRLGEVIYRAQWITFESTPDEILAYTKNYHSSWLFGKKYVVLHLNGRVEWMDKQELETLLTRQQSSQELEMLRKKLNQPQTSDF